MARIVTIGAAQLGPVQRAHSRADVVERLLALLRDAHVRDFEVTLLEDGCAAFSPVTHDATVASLRALCPVMSIADAMRMLPA